MPLQTSVPCQDPQMDGAGKSVIITGAGSGIGRAVAIAMVRSGFRVAVAGRRQDALEETAAISKAESNSILVVPTDVTEADSVAGLFAATKAEWGRIDVLFNNAGVSASGDPLEDESVDAWRRVVDVNLTGSFLCTQQAFRHMQSQSPQGGRIINNGSVSASAPRPNSASYTATKHAITGLTKSTSLDGRKYNIACGQIDIGNAGTDMTSRMAEGVPQANGTTQMEPTIDVQHIADAVIYMASLPLEANVQFMTVMATSMPLVGRG